MPTLLYNSFPQRRKMLDLVSVIHTGPCFSERDSGHVGCDRMLPQRLSSAEVAACQMQGPFHFGSPKGNIKIVKITKNCSCSFCKLHLLVVPRNLLANSSQCLQTSMGSHHLSHQMYPNVPGTSRTSSVSGGQEHSWHWLAQGPPGLGKAGCHKNGAPSCRSSSDAE